MAKKRIKNKKRFIYMLSMIATIICFIGLVYSIISLIIYAFDHVYMTQTQLFIVWLSRSHWKWLIGLIISGLLFKVTEPTY